MQNKGFVIVLTVVLTALCLFYLSFTFVSKSVQKDATEYATGPDGIIDLQKKQAYIDSVWNKPVYNFFGVEFTYSEVKDKELSMGLDLLGGMHVTLEISPVDILKGLAGNNSQDSAFVNAIAEARKMQKESQENFTELFFRAFKENNPDKKLSHIFANPVTRDIVSLNASDEEVMEIINEQVENAIDRSYTILSNRLDQFGTSSPNIQILPGTGRIQIEVPGADNPQRVRKLLQGVARLEFWDVIEPYTLNNQLMAINDLLVKEQQQQAGAAETGDAKPEPDLSTLLSADTTAQDTTQSDLEKQLQASTDSAKQGLDSLQNVSALFKLNKGRGNFRYDVKDTATINNIFNRPEVKNLLRGVGVYWANKPETDNTLELFFLDKGPSGKPELTGEVITNARQVLDQNASPAVSMAMNTKGTKIWAKMTAEAVSKQPPGRIAIVLDDNVYSAPVVQSEIPNGHSEITGNFTVDEAKDLANVLRAGSLPAPTRIVEEAIVGPTLGQVASQQGLVSIVSGLALVVIFMVAYYAKGGWVANIALLFNIFFLLGILAQPTLGTALTLPGIAGIVLTMGMAVDANVLIYERIKEELAHGKKLKEAIRTGYSRAFWTIFDSNLTTLITGIFLFMFGQGPIKGFATTLMIGIVTSFFSAIYISRLFIEWMARRGDESKISFDTFIAKLVKKRKRYAFVKNSRLAYTISSAIIVVGFILLFIQGLNLGVDFKGGRSFIVTFNKPVSPTELKVDLARSFENAGTEVKMYGSNNVMKVTTSYLIDEESDDADDRVKTALIGALEAKFPGIQYTENESQVDDQHFTISSSTKVEPTVAQDIKESAWKASLFSLIGIFVYILIRFRKYQYSIGAIASTVHDTLFVFAAFAIARVFGVAFEIDQVFVAAILTIIGYSINDTVIIFDRIREYLNIGTSHDKAKIINDAINDTLSRTIITSGTTLLVVVVLLIFGGEVLRGFAFALFVGFIVGTFSSMFIAGPVILDLDKDEGKKVQSEQKKKAVPA